MFYPESERFYRRKQIDTRKLMFEYYWIDLKEAARKAGKDLDLSYTDVKGGNNAIRGHSDRRGRLHHRGLINVYPDTLSWVHDFTYSYNEPMTENYFWHPAYDDYPVVGVTWSQAKAFNVWRTQNMMNAWLQSDGEPFINHFRLPTEAESGNMPHEVAWTFRPSSGAARMCATVRVASWRTSSPPRELHG